MPTRRMEDGREGAGRREAAVRPKATDGRTKGGKVETRRRWPRPWVVVLKALAAETDRPTDRQTD